MRPATEGTNESLARRQGCACFPVALPPPEPQSSAVPRTPRVQATLARSEASDDDVLRSTEAIRAIAALARRADVPTPTRATLIDLLAQARGAEGRAALDEELRWAIARADAETQALAVQALAEQPPSDAEIEAVRGLLSDAPDASVRAAAVRALLAWKGAAPQEALARALADGAPEVRRAATAGMSAEDASQRALLFDAVARDADDQVRLAAVAALGKAPSAAGVRTTMERVLRVDPSEVVRRQAEAALADDPASAVAGFQQHR